MKVLHINIGMITSRYELLISQTNDEVTPPLRSKVDIAFQYPCSTFTGHWMPKEWKIIIIYPAHMKAIAWTVEELAWSKLHIRYLFRFSLSNLGVEHEQSPLIHRFLTMRDEFSKSSPAAVLKQKRERRYIQIGLSVIIGSNIKLLKHLI